MKVEQQRYSIAIVCDFFYPQLGGVENHIWSLAQALIRKGHKVIILTKSYGDREGVRYMESGLKVYYLPLLNMAAGVVHVGYYSWLHLWRQIMIREKVQIVHYHQSTTLLQIISSLYCVAGNIKTVYTDHSLMGFADTACVSLNKIVQCSLSNVDHMIAVSYTSRETLCLRTHHQPQDISVIPNAVDATRFYPNLNLRGTTDVINVVVLSRLVYRKGVDLLLLVIPMVCKACPKVHFIIGGDGNKKIDLECMIYKYRLQDRVELLGGIEPSETQNIYNRGDVFLNCSLTEAFCIAILEAAACGLEVVSTPAGGVEEVLPSSILQLCTFESEDIAAKLIAAIHKVAEKKKIEGEIERSAFAYNELVKNSYSWGKVADRAEIVYNTVMSSRHSLLYHMQTYMSAGPIAGFCYLLLMLISFLFLFIFDIVTPASTIEPAYDFYRDVYLQQTENKLKGKLGNSASPNSVLQPLL
ncbi:hypothetical protein WA158_004106 [Blastocystis sp. Blastoise]